ncbi:MAG: 30S ribosome-binding factor RbfA [Cyanobacteria bacterium P01_A01_bin.137]
MATDRRVARVSASIKREISQMLMSDIKDERVGAGMVSVTAVDVAGDLQHAKVFVSIYGSAEAKAETMAGLAAATSYVKGTLGRRLRLRRTPDIVFKEDVSFEQGTQVLNLLSQLKHERGSNEALAADGADTAEDIPTVIPSATDDGDDA